MEPEKVLRTIWGYSEFRGLQRNIIDSVLQGRDTVAILPTGGGKSICFQVPGLVIGSVTLVISPLIALMADQVANLTRRGVRATSVTGDLSMDECKRRIVETSRNGKGFVYVSPERLASPVFREQARGLDIRLLVIDEAHCISEWGPTFRPDFRRIAEFRKTVCPSSHLIAVTATATVRVERDIVKSLGLTNHEIFRASTDRPNIKWTVSASNSKRRNLDELLSGRQGTKIIYSNTRASVDRYQRWLERGGYSATRYHGGMSHSDRSESLHRWLGQSDSVMVATNAFGMGIDKPDVRLVIHLALPRTVESYYQEAGRGGRDGNEAEAILVYSRGDIQRLRKIVDFSYPPDKQVKALVRKLSRQLKARRREFEWTKLLPNEISRDTGIPILELQRLLHLMVRKRIIDLIDHDDGWLVKGIDLKMLSRLAGQIRRVRRTCGHQVRAMVNYLDLAVCRRRYLLNYFGENADGDCGNCSVCTESESRRDVIISESRVVNYSL